MAKKKEIVLRSGAEEVPAGDVNITYEGTRIAGFSEETDATLKTGGTRVLSDIDVSYTGPLPASTAADAGKVLTVGETGAAEWAAAGGGDNNDFIINFSYDRDQGVTSCDKTYSEVKTAYEAGKRLIVFCAMQYIMDNVTITLSAELRPRIVYIADIFTFSADTVSMTYAGPGNLYSFEAIEATFDSTDNQAPNVIYTAANFRSYVS